MSQYTSAPTNEGSSSNGNSTFSASRSPHSSASSSAKEWLATAPAAHPDGTGPIEWTEAQALGFGLKCTIDLLGSIVQAQRDVSPRLQLPADHRQRGDALQNPCDV